MVKRHSICQRDFLKLELARDTYVSPEVLAKGGLKLGLSQKVSKATGPIAICVIGVMGSEDDNLHISAV